MAVKAMTLVGVDVHARQTHAAIVDPVSGELRVCKLRMTDRRDAIRLVRLLAAGELGFAFVPSVATSTSAIWCARSKTSAAI